MLYMCPHTSYLPHALIYMCPHTSYLPHTLIYMRPHTSYHCDIRVLIPHTTVSVCPPVRTHSIRWRCMCALQSAPHAVYVCPPVCTSCRICEPSSLHLMLPYLCALQSARTVLAGAAHTRHAHAACGARGASCRARCARCHCRLPRRRARCLKKKNKEPQHSLNTALIQPEHSLNTAVIQP
jgi:hypothetical protein